MKNEERHGIRKRYEEGCRCVLCCTAHRNRMKLSRETPINPKTCGKTETNYAKGCRCEPCTRHKFNQNKKVLSTPIDPSRCGRKINYAKGCRCDKCISSRADDNAKYNYGLSKTEYRGLINAAGQCQICGKKTRSLCIDHDHETLKVRGVLCRNCNSAIGFFGDSLINVEKAAEYLKNFYTKERV